MLLLFFLLVTIWGRDYVWNHKRWVYFKKKKTFGVASWKELSYHCLCTSENDDWCCSLHIQTRCRLSVYYWLFSTRRCSGSEPGAWIVYVYARFRSSCKLHPPISLCIFVLLVGYNMPSCLCQHIWLLFMKYFYVIATTWLLLSVCLCSLLVWKLWWL